jgi:hypothetical protein
VDKYKRCNWWGRLLSGELFVRILSGVYYHGNVERMVGEGTIYALEKYRYNGHFPRNDFVTVLGENDTC